MLDEFSYKNKKMPLIYHLFFVIKTRYILKVLLRSATIERGTRQYNGAHFNKPIECD